MDCLVVYYEVVRIVRTENVELYTIVGKCVINVINVRVFVYYQRGVNEDVCNLR